MNRYFHFTLGPVQGFVAQARRTRDFWAGSFLLSWLAAVAIRSVRAQKGKVLFPIPDEFFMAALESGVSGPTQGGVPNRFKAAVGKGFDPNQVVQCVQTAWCALTEEVWDNDLLEYESWKTRVIWQNQILKFWEMQWAITDDENDPTPIDRLKNWRTHLPSSEPGPKCMIMDGWQELSGAERPGREVDEFWDRLRNRADLGGIRTDLRQGECLCAIAYVKRRFTRVFANVNANMPGGWTLTGWPVPAGVPSVQYMAIAPWLAQLIGKASENEELRRTLWSFHDKARKLTGDYGEWDTNIRCVRKAPRGEERWAALDGSVFFESLLENKRLWSDQAEANALKNELVGLQKAADQGPVSPFYAVLMMDGDELGKQMSNPAHQNVIAERLGRFARGVGERVYQHNGFLIYAGGDDVLALLTLDDALRCAAALRAYYLECFNGSGIAASISAAIEYVHIKTPLGKVLKDVHHLLDEVAKDQTGRDAVAVRIWKPGGMAAEWAMPWEVALKAGTTTVAIDSLAEDFRNAQGDAEGMSSKFFYGIREHFALLNPRNGKAPVLSDVLAFDLLAMQFLNSGVNRKKWTRQQARQRIEPLIDQCRKRVRLRDADNRISIQTLPGFHVDGAMLVRFLAQKGLDR
jgi:CRISPR-associated protein Cmr2